MRCVNEVDLEPFPSFTYTPELVVCRDSNAKSSSLLEHMHRKCYPGCRCTNGCGESCECRIHNQQAYGSRSNNTNSVCAQQPFFFGCNSMCACPMSCPRRAVQQNRVPRAEVFKHSAKGWGVRARCTIPAGTFVLRYVGEMLDSATAAHRRKQYDSEHGQHADERKRGAHGMNFLLTVRETISKRVCDH